MYLIRVSTAPNLGYGHIARCIKIRNKINSKVIWFVDKGTKKILSKIIKDDIEEESSKTPLKKIEKYALKYDIKAIIIDMPKIESYNKNNIFGIKPIIVFVDNYHIFKNALSICMHPMKINKANFITGAKYIPLTKKKIINKKNKIKNILVSFGNVDSKCHTEKVIKAFQKIIASGQLKESEYRINIILGKYKKNITIIRKMASLNKNLKVFRGLISLDELYKNCDFALGAPGFSQIERIEYNIPSILIAQNNTHKKLLVGWRQLGCALIVKNIDKDLEKQIILLAKSTEAKKKIKEKISKNFDYNGDNRILKKIKNYVNNFNYN